MSFRITGAICALAAVHAVAPQQAAAQGGGGGFDLPQLVMETDAFEDGGVIPPEYSARGDNLQPGFTFSNAPDDTASYAIIFHDIDVAIGGGTEDVLHWLVWNIPVEAGGVPEGGLPDGAVEGENMAGENAYFGPGAPPGPRDHHYVFELYALDDTLDLPETTGREELLAAMDGHVVAKAAYVGRFRGSE